MKFRKSIKSIKSFGITNVSLGLISIDEKFFSLTLDKDFLLEESVSPIISRSIYVINDCFVVSDILNMCSLIVNNSIVEKELDYLLSFPFEIESLMFNRFYFANVRSTEDKVKKVAKIDSSTFEIKETYSINYGLNGIWKVITDKLFISKNADKIALFNFKNELVWQHSFSKLIESDEAFLYDEIISIENKVFFNVAGSVNGGLFCLDVHSGKELKKYHSFSRPLFQDGKYIYTSQYKNILCRIDSSTLALEEWDVNEVVKEQGFDNIHDHRCVAKEGVFYFTQTLGDDKAKFGVLDFNKKQLLFKHDFEPKNGGIGSIKVSNDRVFIHTQDNTLHIFEKE